MHLPADEYGPESNIEMKNCVCGSTMAVEKGPAVSRDPREKYYVIVRFLLRGEPHQVAFVIAADNPTEAEKFARFKLPKGAIWIGARARRMARDQGASRRFRTRIPARRPDRCFLYPNGDGVSVTLAWGFRRATARFKKGSDATKFARGLKCPITKGSEYSRLPQATRLAIQRKVPFIMKEDGYSRSRAFAAAITMALRGTLKPLKKEASSRKRRARMNLKRNKR
jgi:hypothetical protein